MSPDTQRRLERRALAVRRPLLRLAPLLLFGLLAGLTVVVWRQLGSHRRALITRHAADVCLQAARRIEVLVESRLRVAEIFAERWSSHGGRDFSRARFDAFAGLLARDFAGYRALHLIRPGHPARPARSAAARLAATAPATRWTVPRGTGSRWEALQPGDRERLLAPAPAHQALLSPPLPAPAGGGTLFAAARLEREGAALGHMVVEVDVRALIGGGFHDSIRSEFNLRVFDEDVPLFRFADDDGPARLADGPIHVEQRVRLRNRTWRLAVAPRAAALASSQLAGWQRDLPVLGFGLLLSAGIALLIELLSRRMVLYRTAHDRALAEIVSREQAEVALRASEARYRSVFDAATDGLLVIDDQDRVVEVNPAAAAMHGYASQAELVGLPVTALIGEGHHARYDEFRRQMARRGHARLDSVNRRRDNSVLDVEVRGTRLDDAGEACRLAIVTDVTDRKEALRHHAVLSRKVLLAQEEERARVSRDLHDELGQILAALHLELQLLHKRSVQQAAETGDAARLTSPDFEEALGIVAKAADELRRICKGLRPPLLDDLGLEPALQLLTDEFRDRTGIEVDLELRTRDAAAPLAAEDSLCVYRVVQESLNNVLRHAEASEVSISLVVSVDELLLSVYDDGRGFDVEAANRRGGFGIAGMRERASLVGGSLEIRSVEGEGTRVVLRLARLQPPAQEES